MARSSASTTGLAGIALAVVVALAGCVPGAPTPLPSGTAAGPSSSPTPTAPPEPVLVEGGTAAENSPYFDKVNSEYFSRIGGMGTSAQLIDNLIAAGFRKQDLEVTGDRTSIDLEADSLIFSVRLKGECLIGDYQRPFGYSSMVAPLLGTGSCLIGTTVPIG